MWKCLGFKTPRHAGSNLANIFADSETNLQESKGIPQGA